MFVSFVLVTSTVCLASTALAALDKPFYDTEDAQALFNDFVKEHNKVYSLREYFERLAIFKETLNEINERNEMFPNTVFAINHFADLKPHERAQYSGFKPLNETLPRLEFDGSESSPAAFDWRLKNAVSHVKSQGQCGSCYIFSAVGNIEGQYAIKHGQCLAFSEQQALDCLSCGSCGGGYMEAVMQELAQRNMKLEKEQDYPYTEAQGACQNNPALGVAQCTGGERFTMDEEELKSLISTYGPVSIAINSADLTYYHGGIVAPSACVGQPPDHALLLVGYGEEGGQKFWIIKNSWGTGWGEQGYVRMLFGVRACGLGDYLARSQVA